MKTIKYILIFAVAIVVTLLTVSRVTAQTVVWSENFDDGNGNNRWYADAGVWQIGSPTIGPVTNSMGYRTHSGPDCATTGLTQNYPAGANSRLIRIQTFTVPPANQSPRLRFWHWYSFAIDFGISGYGVVEIKVGTSAWQEVSPRYTGFGGDWTYASVDLSAFAGQTVQLAFQMVDAAGYGGAPGWYVDDIAVLTGALVFNNPEGWERGIGDWYAETGTWQVGTPTKPSGASTDSLGKQAHNGTNCAVTILTDNYSAGAYSRLISPAIIIPATNQSPRLRFWHWYSFATDFGVSGYGVVEIKVGTNAWQEVSQRYTGFGGDWTYASVDLSAFAGQTVQLAFQMVDAAGYGGAPGWYVDDIAVITGALVFNNPEGWEHGIGDWYAETGTWQVGTPTKSSGAPADVAGAQAHSGTNCAVTLLNNNYQAGAYSRLISPPFILPPASLNPYLRFWDWYSFASDFGVSAYGVVEIKEGTNSWQEVSSHYTGSSVNWTEPFVDLTSYGGKIVRLAFQMMDAAGYGGAPGWYVDDIQVFPYVISATSPSVTITRSGANVVLTWLTNFTGFTLQSTTNLSPPVVWSNILTAPIVVNGQDTVTNPISGTRKFYRLIQ